MRGEFECATRLVLFQKECCGHAHSDSLWRGAEVKLPQSPFQKHAKTYKKPGEDKWKEYEDITSFEYQWYEALSVAMLLFFDAVRGFLFDGLPGTEAKDYLSRNCDMDATVSIKRGVLECWCSVFGVLRTSICFLRCVFRSSCHPLLHFALRAFLHFFVRVPQHTGTGTRHA